MEPEIKTKKKLRAALYLRVSTEEQNKEGHYGLEVQEERGRSFRESQEYTLSEEHIYREEKSGGLAVAQRPALKELFAAAARKEFDVVVVYKTDRLARNLRILVNAIHDLERLGVAFRSVTEPFDTTTSFGRANLNLFGTFAEFEKEMIRERTMSGRIKAMKNGKWVVGIPPYGYDVDEKTRKLILNEKEAKVVKQIYEWVVNDKVPLGEIERRLNEKKIPSPYSTKITKRETYKNWYKRTIGRILTNEVVTGTFNYRKYKRPFNNLTSIVEQSRLRPKEEWIPITTPAIISVEMFEATKQQLMKNREFARRNKKREYLYSKLVYCSGCGLKLFGGYQPPRVKYAYEGGRYYHGVYRKKDGIGTSSRCEWCPSYSEPRLEPIWECLKEILHNPKNMLAPLAQYVYKTDDPKITKERLDEIDEQLGTLKNKRSRVYDLLVNEHINEDQCKQYTDEYDNDERKLNDEAVGLRQTLLTKKETTDREVSIRKSFEHIQARLDTVSYDEKAKIISFFIERITLHAKEDYVDVAFRFPSHTETSGTKVVSHAGKSFPLVLKIRTMTEKDRRASIIRANPGMYLPKAIV